MTWMSIFHATTLSAGQPGDPRALQTSVWYESRTRGFASPALAEFALVDVTTINA